MQSIGIWLYKQQIIGYISLRTQYNGTISLITRLHYPSYHPTSRGFADDMYDYYTNNPGALNKARSIPRCIALTHDMPLTNQRIQYCDNRYDSNYTYYELKDGTEVWTTKEYIAHDINRTLYYRGWSQNDTRRMLDEQEQRMDPLCDPWKLLDILLRCAIILAILLIVILSYRELNREFNHEFNREFNQAGDSQLKIDNSLTF